MRCHDKKISYLRRYGYNVISLPRADIVPLTTCVMHKGRLTELGLLSEVWRSEAPVPKIVPSAAVADLTGQATDKIDASIGAKILANLITALGAAPNPITSKYTAAKAVVFHFKDIERIRITEFTLGSYLKSGSLDSADPFVTRYFQPGKQVYVVVEVLRSKEFGVSAFDRSDTEMAVNLDELQNCVSASGTVQVQRGATGVVSFSGEERLPFAFIAAALTWNGGAWEANEFPRPGELALSIAPPPPTEESWRGAVLFDAGTVDIDPRPETTE